MPATKRILPRETTETVKFTVADKTKLNSIPFGDGPPRLTTTQKNALPFPTAGMLVFDTTLMKLCVYTTTWETITSA